MSDIVERLEMGLATPIELEAAAEIKRLRGIIGLESQDLDLDWNRLRSGDNRALISDHQDVFEMVAEMRNEIERLRGLLREAETIIDAATVEHFAMVQVRDRKGLRGWSDHPMLGQITRWKEKMGHA